MAHPEQQAFFEEQVKRFKTFFEAADTVLEVGSQDINGSVRSYFNKRSKYLGVDLGPAKGVDLVVPGQLLELPDGWADIAVTTECLEHAREWRGILANMIRTTKAGGLMLITCAGTLRPTHGTLDSDEYSSPLNQMRMQQMSSANSRENVSDSTLVNNTLDGLNQA